MQPVLDSAIDAVADALRRAFEAACKLLDRAAATALAALTALGLAGCGNKVAPPDPDAGAPPWASNAPTVVPRPGMAWIPKGALVVGTPRDRVPRVADAEMTGEQVVMNGFYIDLFPYPNEAGAIPKTNLTRDEAKEICEATGKRLCTELELERACKGPDNKTFPFGDEYRAEPCGTGDRRGVAPNGFHGTCKSPFGVPDLIGTVWVWTASDWGRGTDGLVALRGGNDANGELVARCANGRGAKPELKAQDVGVRCCAGPENTFAVTLAVTRGDALRFKRGDDDLLHAFELAIRSTPGLAEGLLGPSRMSGSPDKRSGLADQQTFVAERSWSWHPLGNEELMLGAGCTRPGDDKSCGVMIGRFDPSKLEPLAWVSTDHWQPTIGETETARELWIYGGDDHGAFRKRVSYDWGRIGIAEKERKKKRGKKYYFD